MDGGWGILIAGIIAIVAIIIAIVLIVAARNHSKTSNKNITSNHDNEEALEILKLRYVKGEISEEEYIKKKSFLNK